jgi:tetratricopeptide (TPR) repeat protein
MKNKKQSPQSAYAKQVTTMVIDPLIDQYVKEANEAGQKTTAEEKQRIQKQLLTSFEGMRERLQSGVRYLDESGIKIHNHTFHEIFEKFDAVKYSEALEQGTTIHEFLELNDDDLLRCYSEGLGLFERHNYHEAGNIFFVLTQINPKVSAFWSALGAAEEHCNEWQGAVQAHLFAAEINTTTLQPYLQCAQCLIHMHRSEEAKTILERALARAEEEPDLKEWRNKVKDFMHTQGIL